MKGIVFNEFVDFVEAKFGIIAVDQMIQTVNPPSEGAYTTAGYYDYHELIDLVGALATAQAIPVSELVRRFGQHLFSRLISQRTDFLQRMPTVFDFLENIEGYIHVEVRRLYPDADLPYLATQRQPNGNFILRYSSHRRLGDLAQGMIEGCISHYGAKIRLSRRELPDLGSNQHTEFELSLLDTDHA